MMPSDAAFHGLYELLGRFGLPRPRVNYTTRYGRSQASLSLAWPELRMGFSFEGDNPAPLVKAGWCIVPLGTAEINAVAPLLAAMSVIRFQLLLHRSAGTAKRTTSADETALLAALLAAGLPMPDRNLTTKAPDGSGSVTPDFSWKTVGDYDVMVALELDGWFHHGGRDLHEEIVAAAAADPAHKRQLTEFHRDQQAKDAAKGRLLTDAGWHVIRVQDTELAGGATDKVVASVVRLIEARKTSDRHHPEATDAPEPDALDR